MKTIRIVLCTFTLSLSAYAGTVEFMGLVESTARYQILRCKRADLRESREIAFRKAEEGGFSREQCRVHEKESSIDFKGGEAVFVRECITFIRCREV